MNHHSVIINLYILENQAKGKKNYPVTYVCEHIVKVLNCVYGNTWQLYDLTWPEKYFNSWYMNVNW